MESLGEFLKQGRAEAGLSLADLASRTRIRVENLESLEKEDLDALPTDTYVRGFVKQVCRELGLPPHDGLKRYESLRRHAAPLDEIVWEVERAPASPPPSRAASALPLGPIVATGVALAVLAAGAAWWVLRPSAPEMPAPIARDALPAARPAESGELLSDDPERIDAPPVLDAAPFLAPPEPARTTGRPAPPTPAPARAAAERGRGTQAASTPAIRAAPPAPRPATSERLVLTVLALRETEVRVLLDGVGQPRRKTLQAGETSSWKADEKFVVETDDGGAVRLILDGVDRGLAGPEGSPVSRVVRPGTDGR